MSTKRETPENAAAWDSAHDESGCDAWSLLEVMEKLERERERDEAREREAKWKAVAEKYYAAGNKTGLLIEADEAFDRPLAETNKQPT